MPAVRLVIPARRRHNADMVTPPERVTVPAFRAMKGRQQKITMLTAYDYPMARLVDQAGVDAILVGDSMSMVVQGHENTLPVTLDEMIYHAEMVGRAVHRALVIVDMPFPTTHLGVHRAIETAGRILKETRCQAVKLEGGAEQAEVIAAIASAGIPVMAHVGLRPQNVHQMGGYRVQRDEDRLLRDAVAAEQAGAFSIVLECIPRTAAARITREIGIPTIGIGSRGRLRWPSPGGQRSVGIDQRVCSAVRQALCGPADGHLGGRSAVLRGRSVRHVPRQTTRLRLILEISCRIDWRTKPALICFNISTIPWTGGRGATRPSRGLEPRGDRSSCPSVTRRVTGAM